MANISIVKSVLACPRCEEHSLIEFQRLENQWFAVCSKFPTEPIHSKKIFGKEDIAYLEELLGKKKIVDQPPFNILDLYGASAAEEQTIQSETSLLDLFRGTKSDSDKE